MRLLHKALEEKIKKAEKLPKQTATQASLSADNQAKLDGVSSEAVNVFVSATPPTPLKVNDIWIQIT